MFKSCLKLRKKNTPEIHQEEKSKTGGYSLLTSKDQNLIDKREENLKNFSKVANLNAGVLPNQIHYIWIGDELPPKYRIMMLQGKKLNPHYNFNLWYCKEILTKEQAESLESFAKTNKIELHNVTEYQFENAKYIEDGIINKEWAKASDLLRAEHYFAGIYLDTDNRILKKLPEAKEIDLKPYDINIGAQFAIRTHDDNDMRLSKPKMGVNYTPSIIARPYEIEGKESIMSIHRRKMKEKLDKYEKMYGRRTKGFAGTYENAQRLRKTTGCIVESLEQVIPQIKFYMNGEKVDRFIPSLVKLAYCGDDIKELFTSDVLPRGKGFINCSNADNTYIEYKKDNVKEGGYKLAAAVIQSKWRQHRRDTTSYKYTINRADVQLDVQPEIQPITQNEQQIQKLKNLTPQLGSMDLTSVRPEEERPKVSEKYRYEFPKQKKTQQKSFGFYR